MSTVKYPTYKLDCMQQIANWVEKEIHQYVDWDGTVDREYLTQHAAEDTGYGYNTCSMIVNQMADAFENVIVEDESDQDDPDYFMEWEECL